MPQKRPKAGGKDGNIKKKGIKRQQTLENSELGFDTGAANRKMKLKGRIDKIVD